MTEPLLNVRDLVIDYHGHDGTVRAVQGIDFTVGQQESLALVGESGCGKTSVALALLQLLNARHTTVTGEARFEGDDLLHLAPDAMQEVRGGRIGMIFQDPMTSLNPYLRVGTQIREPIIRHRGATRRSAQQEATQLLESVGFDPPAGRHLRRYPHEFSGGMCQRAMIASSLACSPKLLIADEPTTALDVITQAQVLDLIERKRREHEMALLLITHDLGIVAAVSDRVAVMYRGRIVESGSTRRVYEDPQHDYTKALLAAVPRLDKPRARRLQVVSASASQQGNSRDPGVPSQPAPAAREDPDELLSMEDIVVEFRSRPGVPWKRPDTVRAVDHVNLHIRRGESVGLVGQSGSGKSTLIRAALGLVPTVQGRIAYGGEAIQPQHRGAMRTLWRRMQLVFQDPYGSLNSRLTVGQSIAHPLQHFDVVPRPQRRAEIARLLELVQIDPSWHGRFPHELSGGQRQRVAIARALAPRPELLFCDEPVSALDVSIQAEILNLLSELREKLGLTLLFISHDLAVVRHIADRVGVMQGGRIVDAMSANDIGRKASHAYTQQLLDAVPVPDPSRRRCKEAIS